MSERFSVKWIDELSIDRYRPMMRLLDPEDFEFLRSQPGITSRQVARLRAQRCRIFRGYLRSLSADFGHVCMALKLLIAESQQDRADLARLLCQAAGAVCLFHDPSATPAHLVHLGFEPGRCLRPLAVV